MTTSSVAEARRGDAWSPRRVFAWAAAAEAITWTLLIAGMVLKYVTKTTELGVRIGGGLHGFVFLAFVATVLAVALDGRWGVGRTVLGLASAIVPWATIPFERWADGKALLAHRWRLLREEPRGALEKVLAAGLRRPVGALLLVMGLLVVVFGVLLLLGPPGA
ncbi:integral membrane protein [Kytococcus aerolatus]|uniref:Integral membrane protein n=1 Tax=Kytococcus aerolatus TaxID=592308 RepID=A0A212TDB6_9MICO|nr:DUF3817 domain-containing protein [Kytococcus aerolatus]SNC64013.1 integral membrane protein [Kytococcus aerolatus]